MNLEKEYNIVCVAIHRTVHKGVEMQRYTVNATNSFGMGLTLAMAL